MQNIFDHSSESVIVKTNQGYKIMRPDDADDAKKSVSTIISLGEAKDLPFNFYIVTKDQIVREVNDLCANVHGHSRADVLDKNLADIMNDKETVKKWHFNDAIVMETRRPHFFSEYSALNDESTIDGVSIKMPWLDDSNKAIGILGCTLVLSEHTYADLARHLSVVTNTFLFNLSLNQTHYQEKIYFSAREQEVIDWIIAGRSIRQIADIMGLSNRTVESYYNNVKRKANVYTKAELFDFILAQQK